MFIFVNKVLYMVKLHTACFDSQIDCVRFDYRNMHFRTHVLVIYCELFQCNVLFNYKLCVHLMCSSLSTLNDFDVFSL